MKISDFTKKFKDDKDIQNIWKYVSESFKPTLFLGSGGLLLISFIFIITGALKKIIDIYGFNYIFNTILILSGLCFAISIISAGRGYYLSKTHYRRPKGKKENGVIVYKDGNSYKALEKIIKAAKEKKKAEREKYNK